eukprot:10321996-Lingulodinium_polyedra.AAC.1
MRAHECKPPGAGVAKNTQPKWQWPDGRLRPNAKRHPTQLSKRPPLRCLPHTFGCAFSPPRNSMRTAAHGR